MLQKYLTSHKIRLDVKDEIMENSIPNKKVIDEIGSKISEILEHSPAKDVEKNLKVVLSGVFSRLDLVTREEFDVQEKMLLQTREKLIILGSKVAKLEEQLGLSTSDSPATAAPDETMKNGVNSN